MAAGALPVGHGARVKVRKEKERQWREWCARVERAHSAEGVTSKRRGDGVIEVEGDERTVRKWARCLPLPRHRPPRHREFLLLNSFGDRSDFNSEFDCDFD